MATLDLTGNTIKITEKGLIRVDGIGVFRRVERAGVIYIEFSDHDRMRSQCRGTKFVEVPLNVLMEKLNHVHNVEGQANEQIT